VIKLISLYIVKQYYACQDQDKAAKFDLKTQDQPKNCCGKILIWPKPQRYQGLETGSREMGFGAETDAEGVEAKALQAPRAGLYLSDLKKGVQSLDRAQNTM